MPTSIAAGNWKMNTTLNEARELVSEMKPALADLSGVTKIVCPPFISLAMVRELLNNTDIIKLGKKSYRLRATPPDYDPFALLLETT